jgi:hypothetical protein
MGTSRLDTERLVELLTRQRIATLDELKRALGTRVDVTVFRKLKALGYRSSYSHGGRYYTLHGIPDFDDRGLWSQEGVHFSSQGTLVSTLEAFVEQAESGWFAAELESVLHVSVKETLLPLVRAGRLAREKVFGLYLYCSRNQRRRKEQMLARRSHDAESSLTGGVALGRVLPDELKAAIILFFSLLDERQRRLYAGLESLKLGHGGDKKIAELLSIGLRTVARGREQLLARDVELERVRRAGGGRHRLEKKRRRSSRPSRSS